MKFKVILCSILIVFASALTTSVWGEKNKQPEKNTNKSANYVEEEIDNFDFLYADDDATYDLEGIQRVNGILDEAYSHLGARYRSGSKGPSSFDCSGFTSYVFKQYDYAIGGSSRDQYARNTPVKRSEVQRGDLVFFTSPHSGKNVGHVGIVVDVDPDTRNFSFIHASSSNGVKVSRSTESNYARRFVGIRRAL